MAFRDTLLRSWQAPNLLTVMLLPLAWLYCALFSLRRLLFRLGLRDSYRAPVPVIIVGNISVGGTGKTPLVIYLVEQLTARGFKPGVISRGYGGASADYPLAVVAGASVHAAGDEPTMIVRRTGVPMCVGPDRRASIERLLAEHDIDLIISDDGLQHFALQRDVELCLIDDTASQANPHLLPAGPYREPPSRLSDVDLVIRHGGEGNGVTQFAMRLIADAPRPVSPSNRSRFDPAQPMRAVAAIGNPQRFFDTCRQLGYAITTTSFPDHHQFNRADIDFSEHQVLMTEKDAVKCAEFADDRHWYLPVNAKLDNDFLEALLVKLGRQ